MRLSAAARDTSLRVLYRVRFLHFSLIVTSSSPRDPPSSSAGAYEPVRRFFERIVRRLSSNMRFADMLMPCTISARF